MFFLLFYFLSFLSTDHIETMMQLLTAVVKKFPMIVPEKSESARLPSHFHPHIKSRQRANILAFTPRNPSFILL